MGSGEELFWEWGILEHDDRLRGPGIGLIASSATIRVIRVGSGARLPGFESQLHHVPAL